MRAINSFGLDCPVPRGWEWQKWNKQQRWTGPWFPWDQL